MDNYFSFAFHPPVLNLHDGPSGIGWYPFFATAFPNTLTMSASWDPSLSYAYSAAIAEEELIRGVQGFLAPIVDLTRTPLAGKECLLDVSRIDHYAPIITWHNCLYFLKEVQPFEQAHTVIMVAYREL